VTWATVPLDGFRWESGTPRVYASSPDGRRYFCPRCGAQLALHTARAPLTIDVTVATLEKPDRYPPTRHVWVRNKLAWVRTDDGLAQDDEETL